MSSTEDRKSPHEVVIVRRRSGGHGDGHHGGAWKIAFADFMTALMCFFLVMWLVNASDKKTITQIATYFNPLRLNDRTASQKGLDDPRHQQAPTEPSKEKSKPKPASPESKGAGKDGAVSQKSDRQLSADRALAGEMDLIRDPYGVLEQIVASDPSLAPSRSGPADSKARMPKDLFDPHAAPAKAEQVSSEARIGTERTRPGNRSGETGSDGAGGGTMKIAAGRAPIPNLPPSGDELTVDRLKAEIAEAIATLQAPLKPKVEIADLGKEILVSITENVEHGMFSVGSSRPTPVLVQVMETVARALAGKGGAVVVRGHTDARQYTVGGYDNWRLSAARAQIAYHMLVRGGLQSERVLRIEGHADRRLRIPEDPHSPQNRRIEILVAKEAS